jgi:anti-anti-sigma factor
MLELRLDEARGALTVTPLVRHLDAGVALRLRGDVGKLACRARVVVVSLEHVISADPSGLAGLLSVLKRMGEGGELRLARASERVRGLLARTGLDRLFAIYEDAAAALAA